MRHFISIAGCVLALAIPIGSTAHHAFSAEFDKDRPLQLEGTVTKVRWINPHAWIYIETQDDEGTATEWMIEGGTPNALMRTGITRKSLPVGSEIVVSGYQSKDRSCSLPYCPVRSPSEHIDRSALVSSRSAILRPSNGNGIFH